MRKFVLVKVSDNVVRNPELISIVGENTSARLLLKDNNIDLTNHRDDTTIITHNGSYYCVVAVDVYIGDYVIDDGIKTITKEEFVDYDSDGNEITKEVRRLDGNTAIEVYRLLGRPFPLNRYSGGNSFPVTVYNT